MVHGSSHRRLNSYLHFHSALHDIFLRWKTYQALWQLSEIYVPSSWDWKRFISSSNCENFHESKWSFVKDFGIYMISSYCMTLPAKSGGTKFPHPVKKSTPTPETPPWTHPRSIAAHLLLGEPFQSHNGVWLLRCASHSSLKRTPQPRERSLEDRLRPLHFLMAQQMELYHRAHEPRRRELLSWRFIQTERG